MADKPKGFGLIKMGKAAQKPKAVNATSKLSCFNQSDGSDSEDGGGGGLDARFQSNNALKLAKAKIVSAMEEDPNVFQYDEIYDQFKKDDKPKILTKDQKKPKYMASLLKYAEKRKIEQEIRFERKVQKERVEEGEEFKDKESFVTSTYKAVLEERKKTQEEFEREEMREIALDVTKQADMSSFYRGLYKTDNFANVDNVPEKEIKFNNKQSDRSKLNIRSRNTDEQDLEDNDSVEHDQPTKSINIVPDLDQDADIDDQEPEKMETPTKKPESLPEKEIEQNENKTEDLEVEKEETPKKPKISREEYVRNLFTKRTVGVVFEEARNRYLQRRMGMAS